MDKSLKIKFLKAKKITLDDKVFLAIPIRGEPKAKMLRELKAMLNLAVENFLLPDESDP